MASHSQHFLAGPLRAMRQKAHGPFSQINPRHISSGSSRPSSLVSESTRNLAQAFSAAHTPSSISPMIRSALAILPRVGLAGSKLAAWPLTTPSQSRQLSSLSSSRRQKPATPVMSILKSQKRHLFGSNAKNTSRELLARVEQTANKNPNSATAQNAFYQALLRADLHNIIVERYQSGNFASNSACEAAYQKALLGDTTTGGTINYTGEGHQLSHAQIQAIGQAVAASSQGKNLASARFATSTAGAGLANGPIRVLVDETFGGMIFKWVKFLLWFAFFTYLSLVVVTVIAESLTMGRRGNVKNATNEAKAEHQNVKFDDVHGCDEAKEELQELVDFLKAPDKFSTLGGKLPKGVLLSGPPGTGKTLLARAVAGESGVPFFFMSGSEFDEIYVGVGAKRVRELFTAAKRKSPAIVFIDELDAIGGKRNSRDAAYAKQTLNQLLTELDGFEQNSGVIIIAATNFPQNLDKALIRPGRFDRNVVVGLPDVRGRVQILKHHIKKITMGKDVNLEALAATTPGFSGAELENIINQAAVHASKAKAKAVSMLDFEWAKDKVAMGAEKKSMVMTEHERQMTAYHEAGHALVIMLNEHSDDKLHKITILPRGMALGVTYHLPAMDKYSKNMDEYLEDIDVCLGGKIAEEIFFGATKVTSGASSDLQKATRIAYGMVASFGMSPVLGNVDLASNYDKLSSKTKELIESEVRRIIEEARARTTERLLTKRKELDLLAKALTDYETLNAEEAFKVIKGEKLLGKKIMPKGTVRVPSGGPSIGGAGMPEIPSLPGSYPQPISGGNASPPAGTAREE